RLRHAGYDALPLDLLPAHRVRRHREGGNRVGVGRPDERPADLSQPRRRHRAVRRGRGHAAGGVAEELTMGPGFQRQDGVLACDGVSLEAAAAQFGTPLYVYSKAALAAAYGAYDRAFAAVPHRICYALKAN